VRCCAEHHDLPRPLALLQHTGGQVTVRMGATVVQLPALSVHATQDGQTSCWRGSSERSESQRAHVNR
jgi:hypothetical protein